VGGDKEGEVEATIDRLGHVDSGYVGVLRSAGRGSLTPLGEAA